MVSFGGLLPDLGVFRRSRDFSILMGSGTISLVGSMTTMVALPYQVAHLTHSYVAVGVLGALEVGPLILAGLYGGALADSSDRRRIVLIAEMTQAVLSVFLLVNAFLPSPKVWVIYVVSLLFATADGLQRPSLDAILPRLVSPTDLNAAISLSSVKWQAGAIVGPTFGGILISLGGVGAAYGVDFATFVLSSLLLTRLAAVRVTNTSPASPLRSIGVGLRYALSRRDLLGTYLIDLAAMVFAYPASLFPFLALELRAPWALGLLYSATAVGSLAATLTSGWTNRVRHYGRAVAFAAVAWGLAMVGVGAVHNLALTLTFLVLAGAADMISGLFRGLIWSRSIPDELRGRLAGLELVSYSVGPQLGQLRASLTAQFTSLRMSLGIGGAACAASCLLLALALPTLWAFDVTTDENVIAASRDHAQHHDSE